MPAQDPRKRRAAPPGDLPAFYYHAHFIEMLDFVQTRYAHVLDDSQRCFGQDFAALSFPAQCLYVRMINRRGRLFPRARLRYAEIGAIDAALVELRAAGFLALPGPECVDELLTLMTRAQLLDALRPQLPGLKNAWKKPDQLAFARARATPEQLFAWLPTDGIVAQARSEDARFLLFLFFGRMQDGLTPFTMRDLGLVRVQDSRESYEARFADREDAVHAYYFAGRLDKFRRGELDPTAALAEVDEWPEPQVPVAMDFRDQLALSLGRSLEHDPAAALRVYGRGESVACSERIIRLLLSSGRRDEAQRYLERCIAAPATDEELLLATDLYARKFAGKGDEKGDGKGDGKSYRKGDGKGDGKGVERVADELGGTYGSQSHGQFLGGLGGAHALELDGEPGAGNAGASGRKRTSTLTDRLRAAPVIDIDEAHRGAPERAVVQWFRARGQRAFRVENSLWRTLFGLLFWDLLYEGAAAGTYSPFERLPSVLVERRFLARRREAIEARLALLDDPGAARRHLLRVSAAHFGTANGLFRWRQATLDAIHVLVETAPAESLRRILRRFCADYAAARHGYPDLMVVDDAGVRFVEVKSDGDQLRRNQLLRLEQLRHAGLRADVLRVRWVLDPAQAYVVVDVETTGGRGEQHRVTEIGAVKVVGGKVVERFQTLLNPQRSIPPGITRLTGITPEMVADAPVFADVADRLAAFLSGSIFVAHNVDFDYRFIGQEFRRLGRAFRMAKLCTCAAMRKLYPGHRSYGLAPLCAAYDIPLPGHHRALCDAQAAAQLLLMINEKRAEALRRVDQPLADEVA